MKTTTHTYHAEITLEVEIEYVYDPGEKRVDYYPDGSGYPGTPPSVAIQRIVVIGDGGDVTRQMPTWGLEDLEAEILENHDAEDDR
jgi:hypothetical protein